MRVKDLIKQQISCQKWIATAQILDMNWHNRFKEMKSGLVLTNSDIANITGNSADSVKSVTQPNKEIPRWLKLAIVVYERMQAK
jgi:hypothetical protein